MKKSKVLIPAMALLLFSTAASITGTVAWFTSVRTFNTSAGDFTVAKLDGDLSCDISSLAGVTINDDGTDHESISVPSSVKMGDASFDHSTTSGKKLYTDTDVAGQYKQVATMTASGGGYTTTASDWKYNTVSGVDYYYAVAWQMEFSYVFGAKAGNINVFFDYHNSVMTPADGSAHASTNDSAKAFRIALFTSTTQIIWSELHDGAAKTWTPPTSTSSGSWATATDTKTYVNSTSTTTAYVAADNFIDSTANSAAYTRATDGTATAGRKDFLGTITNPGNGGSASVKITCVAWYDGTDLNLINETQMRKVSATMQFYACDAA